MWNPSPWSHGSWFLRDSCLWFGDAHSWRCSVTWLLGVRVTPRSGSHNVSHGIYDLISYSTNIKSLALQVSSPGIPLCLQYNPPRPLASGRVEICVLLPVFLFPVFLLPVNRPLPYPSPAARAGGLLAGRSTSHPPGDPSWSS